MIQVPTPTGIQRSGRDNVVSTSDDDNTASGGTSKTLVQNKSKCASASTRFTHSTFLSFQMVILYVHLRNLCLEVLFISC